MSDKPQPPTDAPMPADAPVREQAATFRPVAEGMEKHLNVYHPVLDHGFIAVKDYMGDDVSVLQMARMSYGKGTKSVADDRSLLRYLMRHFHTSPFEGCVIKLHVKLPIFVMRQWVRHRTASLNEYSARYSIMPDEFYMPDPSQLAVQSKDNKQGRGDNLTPEQAEDVLRMLKDDATRSFASYHKLLNADEDGNTMDEDRVGIARELARIGLPVSAYTQMYWQTNLHNLMHFLRLRADVHAQYEIRVYADKMLEIMADWVPVTTEAFRDYQLEAGRLSRMELALVKDLLAGKATMADAERYGMTKREIREFQTRFEV
jgi:thymidylate synthase (FAD)